MTLWHTRHETQNDLETNTFDYKEKRARGGKSEISQIREEANSGAEKNSKEEEEAGFLSLEN